MTPPAGCASIPTAPTPTPATAPDTVAHSWSTALSPEDAHEALTTARGNRETHGWAAGSSQKQVGPEERAPASLAHFDEMSHLADYF